MHQYHAADAGRIRYLKVCELDEEPVEAGDIVKGIETADDEVVLLDDDDLAGLPVSSSKAVEVLEFVPASEIDPIHYEKSYFLEPDKAAARPYVLLREALVEKDRIAIVKVTLRRRESLAVLRPRGEVLMLHTMLWPDEIRNAQTAGLDAEAQRQELDMAGTLIDAMSKDAFDPEQYSDDYQQALQAAIDAKAHGRAIAKAGKAAPKAQVIDLMEALAKSVDQAGQKRPGKKTARKTAAKQAAKQADRKKTKATAKKTANRQKSA